MPKGKTGQHTHLRRVQHTQVSGYKGSGTDMEYRYGLMGPGMKVSGKTTELMAKAGLCMWMGTYMMETGSMTKPMDSDYTFMSMEPGTKDSGKTICNMDKVKKLGQMGLYIKENTNKERNMDMVHTAGMMVQGMKENGLRTK